MVDDQAANSRFWLDKWAANQIGFHEDRFHPLLCRFWEALGLQNAARVFVPLCGKSRDLLWLRERGHEVVGVELSEIAARAFFEEHELEVDCHVDGKFKCFSGAGCTILCGDIFDLSTAVLGTVDAVYDRAALIALPPPARADYARQLRLLCEPGTQGLLVTLAYPPEEISPPPYLVDDDEVHALYGKWCMVDVLGTGAATVKGIKGRETAFHFSAK